MCSTTVKHTASELRSTPKQGHREERGNQPAKFQILQPQKRKKKQSMETKTTDSNAVTTDQSKSSMTTEMLIAGAGHRRRVCGSHHHRRPYEGMLEPGHVVGVR